MAYLLPLEMATALVELVGALLRDEVRLSTGEFEGALRILLGVRTALRRPSTIRTFRTPTLGACSMIDRTLSSVTSRL